MHCGLRLRWVPEQSVSQVNFLRALEGATRHLSCFVMDMEISELMPLDREPGWCALSPQQQNSGPSGDPAFQLDPSGLCGIGVCGTV